MQTRIDQGGYPSPRHFDQDMARLFERARRWYTPGSEAYGHSILLQVRTMIISKSVPPTEHRLSEFTTSSPLLPSHPPFRSLPQTLLPYPPGPVSHDLSILNQAMAPL